MRHQPDEPCDANDAEIYVASTCFKTGPPGMVGVELEWLVHDPADPRAPVPAHRLDAVTSSGRTLPMGGVVTTEPGGQLELSSHPEPSLRACLTRTGSDLAHLTAAAAAARLRLTGVGIDPLREPRRVLTIPRYDAMERHFDRTGPHGRWMMCSTASVQVCLDAGEETGGSRGAVTRWRALHGLGPVLVATFANSPIHRGRPTGWRSTRWATWSRIDPSRTRPAAPDGDPRERWARYALDATVLGVFESGTGWASAPTGMTFREWANGAGPRPPTYRDLETHLSTLFPPVRPRGFFELRVVDAQSHGRWAVVAALVAALLDDPRSVDVVLDATTPVRGRWLGAARDGLSDPALATAARRCFDAALPALRRLDVPDPVPRAVEEYFDRYVARNRCPADDVLDAWSDGHPLTGEEYQPCLS